MQTPEGWYRDCTSIEQKSDSTLSLKKTLMDIASDSHIMSSEGGSMDGAKPKSAFEMILEWSPTR